jgi:hypothetical protein
LMNVTHSLKKKLTKNNFLVVVQRSLNKNREGGKGLRGRLLMEEATDGDINRSCK